MIQNNIYIDKMNLVKLIKFILILLIKKVIKHLEDHSKKVTPESLNHVATISANNDLEIGNIITEAYKQVGQDGVVTVEKSMNHETYAEITNGIKIDRGYTSNLFLNNLSLYKSLKKERSLNFLILK